jgi:CheY-like chemotaxis protein
MPEPPISEPVVLLAEDNQDDVLLVRRAFERAGLKNQIHIVQNGLEAIAYLNGDGLFEDREKYPLPDLVLLDLRMPKADGLEVLGWIRHQWEFLHLCVVMLTSCDEIHKVNQAYALGANSFLVKPLDFVNAAELMHSLHIVLAREV